MTPFTVATALVLTLAADPVAGWAERHGTPLHSAHAIAAVGPITGGAQIVGLGEAAHGVAELTTLKHRTLRYLVQQRGFRAIAWEEDWSLGTGIDDYVLGRRDDRDALVARMSSAWRTPEVAEVLTWLREYNSRHRDKVRFAGMEYYATRPLAYDAIEAYVARVAPDRLAQARQHLGVLRPPGEDLRAHLVWYRTQVTDKGPYLAHADDLYDLVTSLPDDPVVRHHARQVRSWYTAFALPDAEIPGYRDARAAENLRWWHEHTGQKVVYWAAAGHTARAAQVRITAPGQPDTVFRPVGSYVDAWYGDRYRVVGYTFDHGSTLPPPAPGWFERPLGTVRWGRFVLDLRAPGPPAVDAWRDGPMLTRGHPAAGHASQAAGGTVAQWFDGLVHTTVVG